MALIDPAAVVPLPPGITSRSALFEYLGFEELRAKHPDHELFVYASRQLPGNPFAIIFRMHYESVAAKGWPDWVCPVKRWVVVTRDIKADLDNAAERSAHEP